MGSDILINTFDLKMSHFPLKFKTRIFFPCLNKKFGHFNAFLLPKRTSFTSLSRLQKKCTLLGLNGTSCSYRKEVKRFSKAKDAPTTLLPSILNWNLYLSPSTWEKTQKFRNTQAHSTGGHFFLTGLEVLSCVLSLNMPRLIIKWLRYA